MLHGRLSCLNTSWIHLILYQHHWKPIYAALMWLLPSVCLCMRNNASLCVCVCMFLFAIKSLCVCVCAFLHSISFWVCIQYVCVSICICMCVYTSHQFITPPTVSLQIYNRDLDGQRHSKSMKQHCGNSAEHKKRPQKTFCQASNHLDLEPKQKNQKQNQQAANKKVESTEGRSTTWSWSGPAWR